MQAAYARDPHPQNRFLRLLGSAEHEPLDL